MTVLVDYYQVLSVPENASEDQIRQAFRRMAKKYHPDVNKHPGASEMFRAVYAAYEILGDPRRRMQYDHLRSPARATISTPTPRDETPVHEWEQQARKKAAQYEAMPFEEFIKTALFVADVAVKGVKFTWKAVLIILSPLYVLFGVGVLIAYVTLLPWVALPVIVLVIFWLRRLSKQTGGN